MVVLLSNRPFHARMYKDGELKRTANAVRINSGTKRRVFRTPRETSYEQSADPSDEDFAGRYRRHNSSLNFFTIFFSALEMVICETPSSLAISACGLFSRNLCLKIYLLVSLKLSSTREMISAISILS